MLGVLIADFPDGPSSVLKGAALAAATPSPSPSIISSDYASALPSWLLVALLGVVTLVIVGAFALTAYSLSAPRSTLKNIIGRSKNKRPWNIWDHFGRRPSSPKGTGPAPRKQKSNKPPGGTVSAQLVKSLATSARSGRRTTRTTLAIVGFSLLGVVIIAIFGLSGQGVRDLRSQVIAAVTTLVATIAGFYFGAEAARNQGAQSGSAGSAPVFRPDPKDPGFIVGQPGTYTPILTGTPPPTVSLTQGTLPSGLKMDAHTGVISGTAEPGTAGQHTVTLTAKNGISPDVTLPLTLTVAEHPPPTTPPPTPPPTSPPPTSPPPTTPPPTTPPPTSPPTTPPPTSPPPTSPPPVSPELFSLAAPMSGAPRIDSPIGANWPRRAGNIVTGTARAAGTIFVSVAAYRDPDLMPTIADCLAKARDPDRLRFGICHQYSPDEAGSEQLTSPQFAVHYVDWRLSKGACWARAEIMKFYDGEDWYLQLDSHHRFAPDWDAKLIEQAALADSAKPVLSTYAAGFVAGAEADAAEQVTTMEFDCFTAQGLALLKPALTAQPSAVPTRARFISAHFLFAPGSFVLDVPYDPELYFIGEEITLAVRAFTHGYDLFHPARHILWHEYTRANRIKHWDDHTHDGGAKVAWYERDAASLAKARRFLTESWVGRDGAGRARSVAEYEAYAGISFRHRRVQDYTRLNKEPPNPIADPHWAETELASQRTAVTPGFMVAVAWSAFANMVTTAPAATEHELIIGGITGAACAAQMRSPVHWCRQRRL